MNDFPDFDDLTENEPLPKVNQLELMENVLNCTTEEKIRLLKFVFSDLDLISIKEASDKLGITTNGVRSTRELIGLGGKKYVRLNKNT
tara:strand:- start:61 stop:324 length:264 start_codon:yes stop_codon:yes gene_type:complete